MKTLKDFIIFSVLITMLVLIPPPAIGECVDGYAPFAGARCWNDYTHLMDGLMDPSRRSRTIRIVQARNQRETPMSVHNQYFNACFFFATAPILEYLGFSRFHHRGHFIGDMWFMTRNGPNNYYFDVGYRGSPEDLIRLYFTYEAIYRAWLGGKGVSIYPCGFFDNESTEDDPGNPGCCDKDSDPRVDLNLRGELCNYCGSYNIFNPGQEYGQCQTLTCPSHDFFPGFLNEIGGGCGGDCPCRYDAGCGMFFFLNTVLPYRERLGGCRDAQNFDPANPGEVSVLRRVIKVFIDNNIPLLGSFNRGGHFMTIVGYADRDENGLPRTAIVADPVQLVYWTADLLNWDDNERWYPTAIYPWNQHLDRACERGGWAWKLDRELPTKFQLCRMCADGSCDDDWPAGWAADRYYGIKLTCENNSVERSQHFTNVEDPFISDSRCLDCDKVKLRYIDGQHEVTWARINRYRYDSLDQRWYRISRYTPDEITILAPAAGRMGPQNVIEWDEGWRDNYWMVAQGLSGRYPMRRTTIELGLDNGETRRIEVTPPNIYGIEVKCINNTRVRWYKFSEADHEVFKVNRTDHQDHMVFTGSFDCDCDQIEVKVNLGYGSTVAAAELDRHYYGTSREWRQANPTWEPNNQNSLTDGLSGSTRRFVWDENWPNNYWLIATDVGSGSSRGDRKTNIRLLDSAGKVIREIEIVPY